MSKINVTKPVENAKLIQNLFELATTTYFHFNYYLICFNSLYKSGDNVGNPSYLKYQYNIKSNYLTTPIVSELADTALC